VHPVEIPRDGRDHHAAELKDMQFNPLAEMPRHHQHHLQHDADKGAAFENLAVDQLKRTQSFIPMFENSSLPPTPSSQPVAGKRQTAYDGTVRRAALQARLEFSKEILPRITGFSPVHD
jgi:hypothetical protein